MLSRAITSDSFSEFLVRYLLGSRVGWSNNQEFDT